MFGMRVYNQDLKELINRYLRKKLEKDAEKVIYAMLRQSAEKRSLSAYGKYALHSASRISQNPGDLQAYQDYAEFERSRHEFNKIERERAKQVFARQRNNHRQENLNSD